MSKNFSDSVEEKKRSKNEIARMSGRDISNPSELIGFTGLSGLQFVPKIDSRRTFSIDSASESQLFPS
jgi:hypothetical protein